VGDVHAHGLLAHRWHVVATGDDADFSGFGGFQKIWRGGPADVDLARHHLRIRARNTAGRDQLWLNTKRIDEAEHDTVGR
jgi:hypothetical protein